MSRIYTVRHVTLELYTLLVYAQAESELSLMMSRQLVKEIAEVPYAVTVDISQSVFCYYKPATERKVLLHSLTGTVTFR
jgi:hypothetical protein